MFFLLGGKMFLFCVMFVGIGGVGCCLLWRVKNGYLFVNVVVVKFFDNGLGLI